MRHTPRDPIDWAQVRADTFAAVGWGLVGYGAWLAVQIAYFAVMTALG